jgi:hypothetical protein
MGLINQRIQAMQSGIVPAMKVEAIPQPVGQLS